MITLVYGPQASGKTRNREALAKHYGHATVIDGVFRYGRKREFRDDAGKTYFELPDDALILAAMTAEEAVGFLARFDQYPKASIIPIENALEALET